MFMTTMFMIHFLSDKVGLVFSLRLLCYAECRVIPECVISMRYYIGVEP